MGLSVVAGVSSGVLAYLAFPPADLGVIAFVALIPLVIHFRVSDGARVALASVAFGLTFFGLLVSWLRLNTPLGYAATVVLLSAWVIVALQAGHVVHRLARPAAKLFVFPLAFLAGEFFRARIPLGGFSWGELGYSQHNNTAVLRLAAYAGVWGLSLLILLVNALLAEAILRIRGGGSGLRALRLAGWGALLAILPAIIPRAPGPSGHHARLALVQGNVPEGTYNPHLDDFVVLKNHIRVTRRIAGRPVSLVVWPESSMEEDPFKNPEMGDALGEVVRETKRPFLVGALIAPPTGNGGFRLFNSSLLVSPQGKILKSYAKQRLVPFGEWVPFRRLLTPYIPGIQRVPVDISPGREPVVFSLPQGKFSVAICYESTYPDLVRSFIRKGARLLIVSSNNSSFGRSAASAQHVAFAQVRAAENRIWVAQAAVSGISAVIAPDGRIVQESRLFEDKLMLPRVQFAERMTPYARFGDWVALFALNGLLIIAAIGSLTRPRTEKPAVEPLQRSKLDRQPSPLDTG